VNGLQLVAELKDHSLKFKLNLIHIFIFVVSKLGLYLKKEKVAK